MIGKAVEMDIRQYGGGSLPVNPVLLEVLLSIYWVWSHGFLIALSDYLCQSYVLHWYYKSGQKQ